MSVQERKYMGRDDEQSLFPEVPEISAVATEADFRAATIAVEAELKKLKQTIKVRDEQIVQLKSTVQGLMKTNLEKPEMWPIVEGVCTMLCGLVYCRPIDESDRLRIMAAADKGHALLDQIAGCPVNFPAARLLYEEASRQYFDFANRTKKETP